MTPERHGSWHSPIDARAAVAAGVRRHHPRADGEVLYWLETRPSDGGRTALVRQGPEGEPTDVAPAGHDVRTRYLEYGGTGYAVGGGVVVWVDDTSGRMWVADRGAAGEPRPLTSAAEPLVRWSPMLIDPARGALFALREDQRAADLEPVNSLVLVSLDPAVDEAAGSARVLVAGRERPKAARAAGQESGATGIDGADFVTDPALSPEGTSLAWITWDHPAMAWDATTLWCGQIDEAGHLSQVRAVAGGPLTGADLTSAESIEQPAWLDETTLLFLSDRSGRSQFFTLDTADPAAAPQQLTTGETSEFGTPRWVPDMRGYGLLSDGRIASGRSIDGFRDLVLIDPSDGAIMPIDTGTAFIAEVVVLDGDRIAIQATTQTAPVGVFVVEPVGEPNQATPGRPTAGAPRVRAVGDATPGLPPEYAASPESFWWESGEGQRVHGFLYRPTHPDHPAEPAVSDAGGDLPPLILTLHGGPTACAIPGFSSARAFWTSRGFAVLDVNYGGSTGFGRDYRRRLLGQWGVVDVRDAASGALALAKAGVVDGDRLLITGGSAGGFTTLAAATFTDTFAAGASHFGVSDLSALAADTHKLESRYTDGLVGPYPAAEEVYAARSPIHHTDRLRTPLILLQGSADRVVPQSQAETMAEALRAKALPVALVVFDGEGHGFRDPANQARALEAELSFYAQVLGFEPAGLSIEPVVVENL